MKRWLMWTFVLIVVVGLIGSSAMAQSPWTQQTSGTTEILRGLKVMDNNVVWASGMVGVVLRTTDGGTTWEVKTAPDATFDNYEIEAIDANTAWVYGTDDNSGVGSKIWKTTDGGTTWNQQYSDADGFGDGIRFFDANNGIALGDPFPASTGRFAIMTTTDGGTTWIPITNQPPADSVNVETGVTNGLDLVGSNAYFITYGTGGHPMVWKSTDKGLTWTGSPRIAVDDSYGFSMADDNHGITSNINSGSIARTVDGWATADSILVFDGTYGLRSVDWIPGSDVAVIVGGPTGAGISGLSTDGGVTWTQKDLPAGVGRLRQVMFDNSGIGWAVGNGGAILKWTDPPLVSVKDRTTTIPTHYALDQNYPNPFNPTTTIGYSVPKAGNVELKVYDVLGQEVAVLVQGQHGVGEFSVVFDAKNLSSGVYFYTLRADNVVLTKSLVLMK